MQTERRPAGKLMGSLDGLTAAEKQFVLELLGRGHDVKIIPSGPNRTPDFEIDGVPTELKTLSEVAKQKPDGLSAALSSRILDARGQSRNIFVDARKQPGMTQNIAQRGIDRAIGADNRTGRRIHSVTVITPDGEAIFKRH